MQQTADENAIVLYNGQLKAGVEPLVS